MNGNRWIATIQKAQEASSGRIHLHLSRKWSESHPIEQASKLFHQLKLHQSPRHQCVLLYLNTRRHKFALVASTEVINQLGAPYWSALSQQLEEDLCCTQFEKAVDLTLETLGISLKKHFPQN